MATRVHRSPAIALGARRSASVATPSSGAVGVLFSLLGAAVYFATVLFAIGDGGIAADTDLNAGRVTLAIAALLSAVGLSLGAAALKRPGARGGGFVGVALGLAFLAFAGLSLWKSF